MAEQIPQPPAPPAPPAPYKLNDKERAILQRVVSAELQIKGRIFDLNAALEGAQKNLLAAQSQYDAVVGALASSQDWDNAEPSPDFTMLLKKG